MAKGNMSRAEELANELFPEPKLENYDDILIYRADRDNAIMGRAMCYRVYEQAVKDIKEWIDEQLSILDKQTLLHPDDDVFWGQRNAYKQMKDKLNSL